MKVQVDDRHYTNMNYYQQGRLISFWHQLDEVSRLKPSSVLEIGKGNGMVSRILSETGVDVKTLDFDPAVNPDIESSVLEMPLADATFDVALCCQVLEHLPYDQFVRALKEIRRVIRKTLVLSLPDFHRAYRVDVQLPVVGELRFLYSLPRLRPPVWNFDGEHYWNISCKGYPLHRIKKDIEASGFKIERVYCVFEYAWHRFFILQKR